MIGLPALPSLLANLPLLLTLGAAVVVSACLLNHRQDLTSSLALSGFSGLLVAYTMTSLTPAVAAWLGSARPERDPHMIVGAFTLAGSTMAALAVGCLAGALWLGRPKRVRF